MRAVVQRVASASVTVDGKRISEIGKGMLVLICVMDTDTQSDIDYMIKKLPGIRIFSDSDGKMNLSAQDIGGQILLVSQFTLAGDARKGTRPSYSNAARPEKAFPMYNALAKELGEFVPTKCGVFGADMSVELVNDGPVTVMLDSTRLL